MVQITVGVVMGSFAVPARYVAQCMFICAGWLGKNCKSLGRQSFRRLAWILHFCLPSCAKGFSQGTQKVFWTYGFLDMELS
jgi:hypothetical protein